MSHTSSLSAMLNINADEKNQLSGNTPVSGKIMYAAAITTVICIGMWSAYAQVIKTAGHNPVQAELKDFKSNWQGAIPFTSWKPRIAPSQAELLQFYQKNSHSVGIVINHYRNQKKGSELISSLNRLVHYEDPVWIRTGVSARGEIVQNKTLSLLETRISGRIQKFVVWHWYWINGKSVTSDYMGKLLQAKNKLLLQGDDGASVMILAPFEDNPDEARSQLREFMVDNLSILETMLANNIK